MWLGHHFQGQKVKGQGHKASLLTAAFGINASGSCSGERGNVFNWLWQPTATSAGVVGSAAGGTSVLTEGGEGRGHIVVAAAQLVIRNVFFLNCSEQQHGNVCNSSLWNIGTSSTVCLLYFCLNLSLCLADWFSLHISMHSMHSAVSSYQFCLTVHWCPTVVLCLNDCAYCQTFSTVWYGSRCSFPMIHLVRKFQLEGDLWTAKYFAESTQQW